MDTPPIIENSHTYELLRSDLFAGQLNTLLHNRIILGLLLFFAVFLGVTTFSSLDTKALPLVVRLMTAGIVVLLGFVILCATQLIFTTIIVFARAHKGLLGTHTLIITDEGLIERTEFNDSLHRWKGIYRIRETSGYVYLYVTETNYHQIPKRSFGTKEQMKDFSDDIRRRINPV